MHLSLPIYQSEVAVDRCFRPADCTNGVTLAFSLLFPAFISARGGRDSPNLVIHFIVILFLYFSYYASISSLTSFTIRVLVSIGI